jgi:two-component system chemotaxis response regulator CheB
VIEATTLRERVDAVVIGASAGGIDGLLLVLPALPAALPVPVCVVLHLPRERPSLLVDIFAAKCSLKVKEAEDKEPALPGTVYFAPPDYHLLLDSGPQLALSADEPVHFSRPSIDVLFESAADVFAQRLFGVLLTGASEDGAAGLAAVRHAGGVTAVQQPSGSYESQMALSALRLGAPDFLLPLRGIAELLASLGTLGGPLHSQEP